MEAKAKAPTKGRSNLERRLRVQITVTVFLALFVLLGLITLITNTMDLSRVDTTADSILDIIMYYNGSLPSELTVPNTTGGQSLLSDPTTPSSRAEETREARYFVLTTASDGTVLSSNLDNTSVVDQQQAADFARRALGDGTERGYVDNFRYLVRQNSDGSSTIAFLDRERQRSALLYSVRWEAFLSILAALLVSGIVAALSGRIVRPIVESHRRQQQFVTNAGHDLRTPVSIISADADVLALEVGQNEWLDDIKKQVGVMTDLTESLVTLAKASEGVGAAAELVNLTDIVSESIKGFSSRAQLENHELRQQLEPSVAVIGEPQYLARLASQLVDNALKYTTPGAPIEITLRHKGRQAVLKVRNATQKVDPSEVSHWFDRFYQSDKARTHRGGGFGIGLSMVQAVAEAHGGKATGEAAPDGSSVTVTVTLPLAKEGRHEKQSK